MYKHYLSYCLTVFGIKKTVILITNSFFYINKYLYFVFLTFFCCFHVKRTIKSLFIENLINGAAQLVVILKLQKKFKIKRQGFTD
jgi:hypothetical protein